MSQKEMKDVNKRLYEKLVEVKYKIKESSKNKELKKRAEMTKNYTNVIIILFIKNRN